MIISDVALLDLVEGFLARTKMAPTKLGILTLGDGGLVKGLRDGRSPSLKNAEKVVRYMAERDILVAQAIGIGAPVHDAGDTARHGAASPDKIGKNIGARGVPA